MYIQRWQIFNDGEYLVMSIMQLWHDRYIYIYSDGEDSMMANIQLWQIFSCGKLDIFTAISSEMSSNKYIYKSDVGDLVIYCKL